MAQQRIGVAVGGREARSIVADIEDLENRGIGAAWLTMGVPGLDPPTLLSAAAVRTSRIMLGTAIVPTWTRHPIVATTQAQTISQLSGGRFRLGVGPSHEGGMSGQFGIDYKRPLTNLREYLQIAKGLLNEGEVALDGFHYKVKGRLANHAGNVPVMASALRRRSFEVCGEYADGAISWVCPHEYLREVALPALEKGAAKAGRETPPLVAHVPICVHENEAEARAAARQQLGFYPKTPFYRAMFEDAGFAVDADGNWTDAMQDAVMLFGDETRVEAGLRALFAAGTTELIVTSVNVGPVEERSKARNLDLVAKVSKSL